MADQVAQIEAALITEIENTMTGYTELDHVYNIEDNKFGSNTDRFGVKVSGLVSAPGVTRNSTVDHNFTVVLTKGYVETVTDDEKIRSSINELHDKMDEILVRIYNK